METCLIFPKFDPVDSCEYDISRSDNPAVADSSLKKTITDEHGGTLAEINTTQGEGDQSQSNGCEEETQNANNDSSEPVIDININNVVCAFALRCHLNLKEIARNGKHVEYRKENSMLNMKLRNPKCTASIWSSGKATVTGATSEDQAYVAARRIARVIQKLGFSVKFHNYRVVNVLATSSLPFGINIRSFSESHRPIASYEPELHPAVTYRIPSPKATLKIFSTGSVTVTGSRVSNVQAAIEHIYPLVAEFRTAYDSRPEYGKNREYFRRIKKQRKDLTRHQYNDYSSDEDDGEFFDEEEYMSDEFGSEEEDGDGEV